MCREIHQRPGPTAERPGLAAFLLFQARPGLGRTGGIEGNAQIPRNLLGLLDRDQLRFLCFLEETGAVPRQALPLLKIDQALEVDLADPQLIGKADERR